MDGTDAARERRRRHHPSHAPAGHGVGLRQRADRDRSVLEPGDRSRRHMDRAVVQDVFVDLVGEHDACPTSGRAPRSRRVVPGEDLTCRVVRRVDHDPACALVERGRELCSRRTSSPARAASPSQIHTDGDAARTGAATVSNKRTRGIVVDAPNNPTGKVFSRDELSDLGPFRKWGRGICAGRCSNDRTTARSTCRSRAGRSDRTVARCRRPRRHRWWRRRASRGRPGPSTTSLTVAAPARLRRPARAALGLAEDYRRTNEYGSGRSDRDAPRDRVRRGASGRRGTVIAWPRQRASSTRAHG